MPPKKGKKGKKGKGKGKGKGGGDDAPEEVAPVGTPEPTEKEVLLQQELDQLTDEMERMKDKVEEVRKENEWLQQEAHRVRIESHEYMSYMEKKTSKRQTTIISLSDQNQKEIQDLRGAKRQMLEEYENKKEALRAKLMEKENIQSKIKQELGELNEYKEIQRDQLKKIRDLEKEVMSLRGKHSEAIQQLKAKFLAEKKEFMHESESKIASMSKQANKEASQCLDDHTNKIKHQNRELRHELLLLIRKTRALHEHRQHLEEQKKQLLMEQQYAQDLKVLRKTRQQRVLGDGGLDDDQNGNKKTGSEAGITES